MLIDFPPLIDEYNEDGEQEDLRNWDSELEDSLYYTLFNLVKSSRTNSRVF